MPKVIQLQDGGAPSRQLDSRACSLGHQMQEDGEGFAALPQCDQLLREGRDLCIYVDFSSLPLLVNQCIC